MSQNALDPLFHLGAARQPAEPSASADGERFSSALEAAVDQRPPRTTPDAADVDHAARQKGPGGANDERQEDASDPADRDEAPSATTETAESTADQEDDGQDDAATLILTTPPVEPTPTPQLAATTIVAALAADAATTGVVETATPDVPIDAETAAAVNANSPTETLPEAAVSTENAEGDSEVARTDDAATVGDPLERAASAIEAGAVQETPAADAEHLPGVHVADTATASQTAESPDDGPSSTRPLETSASKASASASPSGNSQEGDADSQQQPNRTNLSPTAERAVREAGQGDQLAEQLPELQNDGAGETPDEGAAAESKTVQTTESAGIRPWNRIAATRAVHPSAEAEPVDASAMVDRPRFLQRVSGAIEAAERRGGPIQVRLSPPELGSLRIELVMKHGSLAATLETETASARQVLLDNLPALRMRLAEQDIRVDQFDVDVRRDGRESPDHGPSDRPPNEQPSPRRPARGMSASASQETDSQVRSDVNVDPDHAENLDIRI